MTKDTPEQLNCREAGPGKGLCIECANGHYERCLYVKRSPTSKELTPGERLARAVERHLVVCDKVADPSVSRADARVAVEGTVPELVSAFEAYRAADAEPSVMTAPGGLPKPPTAEEAIEYHVRQIQMLCDATNRDPAAWLNDETAQGCKGHETPAPHCLHCHCEEASKGMVDRADFDRMRNALMLIAGTNGTECSSPRQTAHAALSGTTFALKASADVLGDCPTCHAGVGLGGKRVHAAGCPAQNGTVKP